MTFDEMFDGIRAGNISREEALQRFSLDWMETASNYILDINRGVRVNIPEIIYGEYKSEAQTIEVVSQMLKAQSRVIVSRSPFGECLRDQFEDECAVVVEDNITVIGSFPQARGRVMVISAGSADHPVTKECEVVLRAVGVEPLVFEDRGIAHPTRVLEAVRSAMEHKAAAIIVVAGMEGALAPFVASLAPLPVIGVPTSVGYGFRANEAALTSMLASCAPNLVVVNIDGGLRAGVTAALISKNQAIAADAE